MGAVHEVHFRGRSEVTADSHSAPRQQQSLAGEQLYKQLHWGPLSGLPGAAAIPQPSLLMRQTLDADYTVV